MKISWGRQCFLGGKNRLEDSTSLLPPLAESQVQWKCLIIVHFHSYCMLTFRTHGLYSVKLNFGAWLASADDKTRKSRTQFDLMNKFCILLDLIS